MGLGATPMAYLLGGVLAIAIVAIMCYKLHLDKKQGLISALK